MDKTLSKTLFMEMEAGDTRRILHAWTRDGDPCSDGKDPCMNIKRTVTGLQYYCHRCEEGGFVRMDRLSPMEALTLAKRISYAKKADTKITDVIKDLDIPKDSVPVTSPSESDEKGALIWNSVSVPWPAIHWLWAAGFMIPPDITFEVYWSASYNRLIFPIRGENGEHLLGWVGRNVDKSGPKYMTRKSEDKKSRLLYVCKGDPNKVVFTEDILSAIKVHKATGWTTIALLTTALSFSTIKPYKGCEMYLWLDGDMYTKSINKVKRLCALGYALHSVRTELDPKEYAASEIVSHLTL